MKVLVVGSGGREHAIVKALKKSPEITELYCLPGNGGIARDAVCVPIGAKDIDGIVKFAVEHRVDYAVVAPDDPLALGAVDALNAAGVPCFGPRKNAAVIESSKAFAKELMHKYGIPTAQYRIFTDVGEALDYVKECPIPTVVKADGLALGKGVVIASTREEAEEAIKSMMVDKAFGHSGEKIVVEEFLSGPEVSVLAFTDGDALSQSVSSMDHKRALDNDEGLNTGGMGTVAPNPYYTEAVASECMERIFLPTIRAMKAEGRPFQGCLYFGLMITKDGPKVIEYNCRFGDPETQVVLPLLKSDLFTVMRAVTEGRLKDVPVEFDSGAACCVILASKGYPQAYEKGCPIALPADYEGGEIYVAGAREQDGKLYSDGGRVLGVTQTAPTLKEAVAKAYALAGKVEFANGYCRTDIGRRALAAMED